MATVTTSVDSGTGGAKIVWVAPSANGATIDAYKIEILNSADTTWTEDLTNCDGSGATIMTNLYCIVPMATLIAAPYSQALDELVEVRISAQNSEGWSTVSTTNTVGALIRTVPTAMATPTRGSSTTETQIQVDWAALTGADTGNSAITSYELLWDNNSGTANILLTDSLVTTYTVTGLTGGLSYLFKVRAKNVYGEGAYSSDATIAASTTPATMDPPTTATLSGSSEIQISWTAPADGSDALDGY